MVRNPSQTLDAPLETDDELLALPAPPKKERAVTVVMMALTSIGAICLAWTLRSEARYSLSEGSPVDLGDLATAPIDAGLANRYVTGVGSLSAEGAIRYGRAAEGDSFRLAKIAGTDDRWVEIRVPEGFEGPRYVPPGTFAGRWVPFAEAGLRHESLARAVTQKSGVDVPRGAWILIDGTSPRASRWALILVAIFSAFAGWNLIGIARLLSRVRDGERT